MIKNILFLISIINLCFPAQLFSQKKETKNNLFSLSFSSGDYTPYGYIENPYHSMILNRSGVIRSVPPLGFGYWFS